MKNLTPVPLQSHIGGCPGVFELASGEYLIIGRNTTEAEMKEIEGVGTVNEGEGAIVIGRAYFANVNLSDTGIGSTTAPGVYEAADPNYNNPDIADVA